MPVYEAVCLKCGGYHEYIRSISERNKTPRCCGRATSKRVLTAPAGVMDIAPWDSFESPATGKLITSKAQRKEDMKRSGCRDWEGLDTEKQLAASARQHEAKKEEELLDKEVRQVWAQLPPSKKAQALKEA